MSSKPIVPEVLPLAQAYYAKHPLGGNLHVVLDDYNVRDSDIDSCITQAWHKRDQQGLALGKLLRAMSKTQRLKVASGLHPAITSQAIEAVMRARFQEEAFDQPICQRGGVLYIDA